MIEVGKGAARRVPNVHLTRFAAYFVALNAFVEKMRELLHAFAEAGQHPRRGAPEDFAEAGDQRRERRRSAERRRWGHARDTPTTRAPRPL